jgi:hypothetical protein
MSTMHPLVPYADRVASVMFHRGCDRHQAALKVALRDGVSVNTVLEQLPDESAPATTPEEADAIEMRENLEDASERLQQAQFQHKEDQGRIRLLTAEVDGIIERLRKAATKASEERDGSDSYHLLADAVWDIIDEYDGKR